MKKKTKTLKKKRFNVALLMETSNEYSRGVIKGIYGYIKEHDQWDVYLGEYSRGEPNPEWLLSWTGDGIIARIENEAIAQLIKQCNLPTVDTSSANLINDIPWVETDDEKIAEVAYEHLKECGLKNFAFVGAHYNWSQWRGNHFKKLLQAADTQGYFYAPQPGNANNLIEEQKQIEKWLINLPKPIGVFAAYDQLGRVVIDSCHKLGLMVPEQVAVIGVDNDPLICELCSPTLTSVVPDTFTTGYLAATLLESLMNGMDNVQITNRIPPLGIKKRRSSDSLAIDDPHISKALHYIHEHAAIGLFNIEEILDFIPLTRRVFEKKFQQLVGKSPYKEAQRIRVERIKQLLEETNLSLQDISEKIGFEHVSYMSFLFKRETGKTPISYREKFKKNPSSLV